MKNTKLKIENVKITAGEKPAVSFKTKNIMLTIEYDGTSFDGWQRNRKFRTVQGEIERVLSKILNESTELTVAGRTDSGVHAIGQVANFLLKKTFDLKNLKKGINGLLPKDIVIKEIKEAPADFSARFSAKMKTYTYRVLNKADRVPLSDRYCYHIYNKLNIPEMKKAAKLLLGKRDFKMFSAGDVRAMTIRSIKSIKIRKEKDFLILDFTGRSFLRKMVRILAGLLICVGSDKYTALEVKKILAGKMRYSPFVAPAKGLTLTKIKY